ncbi:hypothetical protein HOO68_03920 [Candidatus Gracilibacteria bacterium]|nr:hypothetical protein [Candidatus Gracilibacteria bacterium]
MYTKSRPPINIGIVYIIPSVTQLVHKRYQIWLSGSRNCSDIIRAIEYQIKNIHENIHGSFFLKNLKKSSITIDKHTHSKIISNNGEGKCLIPCIVIGKYPSYGVYHGSSLFIQLPILQNHIATGMIIAIVSMIFQNL